MKLTTQILWDTQLSKQLGNEWCWAACLQMVFNYHQPNNPIEQCDLVAKEHGQNACSDVFDAATQHPKAGFDKALTRLADFSALVARFNYAITIVDDKTVYWQTITQELDNSRPLIANMGFHYVVVFGYLQELTGNYFMYYNPKNEGFSIEKFDTCGIIKVEQELLLINTVQPAPVALMAAREQTYKTKKQPLKVKKLLSFFEDKADRKPTIESIKLVTKIINITDDARIEINLRKPPSRYDEILANKIIGTYELCTNGKWEKVKAKINNINEKLVKQIVMDKKKIDLINSKFDPNKNPSILPVDTNTQSAQFEKIIFQPFVFQFYHIKLSDTNDQLIPINDYTIGDELFKKSTAYPFHQVLDKLKKELTKRQ